MTDPATASLLVVAGLAAIIAAFYLANRFDNRHSTNPTTEIVPTNRYPLPADRTTRALADAEATNRQLGALVADLLTENQELRDALTRPAWPTHTIDITEADLLPAVDYPTSIDWDWLEEMVDHVPSHV